MGIITNQHSGSRNKTYHPMAEINVTPMVDIILVLLIIFMITSPMLVAGVTVDLPQTTADTIGNQDEPLSITIDRKGAIYLQDKKIKSSKLIQKLEAISKQKKDIRIFVRGDEKVKYGKIMDVVGKINAAGFTKVALITKNTGG